MPRPSILLAVALAVALAACAWSPPPDSQPPWTGPRLIVQGANDARLTPESPYWIPFGAGDRSLPLRRPFREALALRNDGDAPLTVTAVTLTPIGGTLPGELTLLAPTRATAVPLAVDAVRLEPGVQLDLDVGVDLEATGVRRAVLTVRWLEGPDVALELCVVGDGEAAASPADRPGHPPGQRPPTRRKRMTRTSPKLSGSALSNGRSA